MKKNYFYSMEYIQERCEKLNGEIEKDAYKEGIRKEILLENDIINTINNSIDYINKMDGKVLDKRFGQQLNNTAKKNFLQIVCDIQYGGSIEIIFINDMYCKRYCTYYYTYAKVLKDDIKIDKKMVDHPRHKAPDYYVSLKNAYITTETNKKRLVSKNVVKALKEYVNKLKKDIKELEKFIKNYDNIKAEADAIDKMFNEVKSLSRIFQKQYDLDILDFIDCYHDYYSSRY